MMPLTKKDLYFIEKHMDNIRDDMLKGISQQINLSLQKDCPKEYREMVNKKTKEYIQTFDFMNTICAKLEMMRLEK